MYRISPRLNISEYSLPGSYRRIINKPSHVSWRHLRYTDPDISLVQSDEDKILNLDPAAPNVPDGETISATSLINREVPGAADRIDLGCEYVCYYGVAGGHQGGDGCVASDEAD